MIAESNNIPLKGILRFKCRFRIFKNGCNAYLKYQHKIPQDIFKSTLKEFGLGYYILLSLYVPFVYIPKSIYNKIKANKQTKKNRNKEKVQAQ